MEYIDYYAVLGVSREATDKQIRSAFRRAARSQHTELSLGDQEAEHRFRQLDEAHDVLSDHEKRSKYDDIATRWWQYEQAQAAASDIGQRLPPFDWNAFTTNDVQEDDLAPDEAGFSAFFQALFAGSSHRTSVGRRGSPSLSYEPQRIEISLAQAYSGSEVTLTLRNSAGELRRVGIYVPPGVENGSRLRAGSNRDIHIIVAVKPDPRFDRHGDDLYTSMSAPMTSFLLGGEERIDLPDGRIISLALPRGSQDGLVLRLPGQGMPAISDPDQRGDLMVELHVLLPEQLSPRQLALIAEFERTEAEPHSRAG